MALHIDLDPVYEKKIADLSKVLEIKVKSKLIKKVIDIMHARFFSKN